MALATNPAVKFQPSSIKSVQPQSYISLFDFSSQYLPDTHEKLANIYGDQRVGGMTYLFGNEESTNSDQFIWSEEGRLHTVYKTVSRAANVFTQANHVFRVGETVHFSGNGASQIGRVTAVDQNTFTAVPYKSAGWLVGTANITAFPMGSEFQKGTEGQKESLQKDATTYDNNTVIMKDVHIVNGSEATQIGWIKTKSGYLWYLESEMETRMRFEDHLELTCLLNEKGEAGSGASASGLKGSEGMRTALKERGNVFDGFPTDKPAWESVVRRMDQQGKLGEHLVYMDRDFSLATDNWLGTLNAGYSGGASFGIFNNSKEMAVNLGFNDFTVGSYSFYKSDSKALNDPTLLGAVAAADDKIRGFSIPMGTKEVYEGSGVSGDKVSSPFLTMKYRSEGQENRRMKTWVTGSIFGAQTDDFDGGRLHMLADRGLRFVGANNFFLFEGEA